MAMLDFGLFLSILALVASLVLLIPRKTRAKAKWAIVLSLAAILGFGMFVSDQMNRDAVALGFQDSADRRAAKDVGISDPAAWSKFKSELSAERGKIAAEREQKAVALQARKAEAEAERARLLRPATDQLAFTTIVENFRLQYLAGKNDLQKGASRPARAKSLCQEIKSMRFVDWIGTVHTLSTNSDGLGVVSIEIAPNMHLKTWNNAVSDYSNKTLIAPESPLYQALMQMKKGDRVRASGQLFRGDSDCFREGSISMDGSMREPEFIARFSDVRAVILP